MPLFLYQGKNVHCFSSTDRWPDRDLEQNHRRLLASIYPSWTNGLGKTIAHSCVCVQQQYEPYAPHIAIKALYGVDPEFHVDVADNVPEREIPAAKDRIRKLHELRQGLRDQLNTARQRQIENYNRRHTPKTFKRGSLVKLSTKNLKVKNKKLQPRFIGPPRITEVIGSQAYRLALPQQYSRLHDVFPIQLLEEYHPMEKQDMMPLLELDDNPEEYEVEEIRNRRLMKGKVHYLIKWTGWPSEYNQWVPENDTMHPGWSKDSRNPENANEREARRCTIVVFVWYPRFSQYIDHTRSSKCVLHGSRGRKPLKGG